MGDFPHHDRDSAPAEALPLFEACEKGYGMVPNLARKMATAPKLLEGYPTLGMRFEQSSLKPAECQVVLLAVSQQNRCQYCVGAHSAIADMARVPAEVTDAIRNDRPIPDLRLEVLRRFTRAVVVQRGWVPETELNAFLAAGFTRQQVLEVILGVGMKTLSNYTCLHPQMPVPGTVAERSRKMRFPGASIFKRSARMKMPALPCAGLVSAVSER